MNPEEGFLGALLLAPARIGEAAAELDVDDMRTLPGRDIYGVMLTLHRRGIVPDLVTVATELDALRDAVDGKAPRSFPNTADLVHLIAEVPTVNYRRYVPQILDAGLRHRLRLAAQGIVKLVDDRTKSAADIHDEARETLASLDRPTSALSEIVDVATFCAGEDSYDWLVPGLIERGERLLIVAGEGEGKTVLMRQLAVCGAYGIHPFGNRLVDPIRVLLLD
ncbi:MAG TPA: DnaB-like helicase N-terminal domain-containing protein, partial [Acidimicrobiales bacterium]